MDLCLQTLSPSSADPEPGITALLEIAPDFPPVFRGDPLWLTILEAALYALEITGEREAVGTCGRYVVAVSRVGDAATAWVTTSANSTPGADALGARTAARN